MFVSMNIQSSKLNNLQESYSIQILPRLLNIANLERKTLRHPTMIISNQKIGVIKV